MLLGKVSSLARQNMITNTITENYRLYEYTHTHTHTRYLKELQQELLGQEGGEAV